FPPRRRPASTAKRESSSGKPARCSHFRRTKTCYSQTIHQTIPHSHNAFLTLLKTESVDAVTFAPPLARNAFELLVHSGNDRDRECSPGGWDDRARYYPRPGAG